MTSRALAGSIARVSTPARRTRLVLVAAAFVFALAGTVLRLIRDPGGISTLLLAVIAGAATVTGILWATYRNQDSALRAAIEGNQAFGGVACAIPLDTPAWGSLVTAPDALVWEPNERARARGLTTVRLGARGRASADFHEVRVGLRNWPAVTLSTPGREPFTVAMSKRSAERLKRLLGANPSDDPRR